jgi:putative copper resistance protein D
MLPKVAFTLVSLASLAGASLTGLRHGVTDWPGWVLRWAAYWLPALLLGTEIWKLFYLQPSVRLRPVPNAVEYATAMLQLHRRWQKVLAPLAALAVAADMVHYSVLRPSSLPLGLAAGGLLLVGLAGIWLDRPAVTLVGLAGAVATMAALDVRLEPAGHAWLLIPNRMLHMWAFSAWLGGALWNIFIAVPAGLPRQNMDTVILANFQLERFRVVVRTVFPTIVATGLVQAWAMFGFRWEALFTSVWGWLVLLKVGLILVLVGVFITCPMWKACSPIRGVCDLDDL